MLNQIQYRIKLLTGNLLLLKAFNGPDRRLLARPWRIADGQ
jgi:hypothetical protein